MNFVEIRREQHGSITAAQCGRLGINANRVGPKLSSGEWSLIARGVYFTRIGQPDPPTLIRATCLSAGPHAVAVMRSAALPHGVGGLRTDKTKSTSICRDPRRFRGGSGTPFWYLICCWMIRKPPWSMASPASTMRRTLADLLLRADRFEAVSTIGAALNRKMITVDDLRSVVESIVGRRGVIRAREWIKQDGP